MRSRPLVLAMGTVLVAALTFLALSPAARADEPPAGGAATAPLPPDVAPPAPAPAETPPDEPPLPGEPVAVPDPEGADEGPMPLPVRATPAEDVEPAPPPAPVYAQVPTETRVLDIRKTHNVTWRNHRGTKALRLDVDLAVVGLRDQLVGAAVDFYTSPGNQPIRSILLPYANRTGQVSVWTRFVQMTKDAQIFTTTLIVPYRAFPCVGAASEGYGVEAVVRILRRQGPSDYVQVANASTTFHVLTAPRGQGPTIDNYTGRERPALPCCSERVQRFLGRPSPIEDAYGSPARAKRMWKPLCPVPGA